MALIGELGSDSIADIKQNNELLKELQQLVIDEQDNLPEKVHSHEQFYNTCMNVWKRIADEFRKITLADCLFYYLVSVEEPDSDVRDIIGRLWIGIGPFTITWYELSCRMLSDMQIFNQFYDRLGRNPAALKSLMGKHPKLLANKHSSLLVLKLFDNLIPPEMMREIISDSRDKNGWTHMFYMTDDWRYWCLYKAQVDSLYDLLSIQDEDGQTALHKNATGNTTLLVHTYCPGKRNDLLKLLAIKNQNGKTALETVQDGRDRLSWLLHGVEHNHYLLYHKPRVLIIYSTTSRPGAEDEAQTIFKAFEDTHLFVVTIEKNKKKANIINLIEQEVELRGSIYPLSALIVIMMSHGTIGNIHDFEGKEIIISSIESAMCQNKEMENRPKILITQCCQGGDTMSKVLDRRDASASTADAVPSSEQRTAYTQLKHPHFCTVMTSLCGQPSERGVFLSKFGNQITNCKLDETIETLVKRVSQEMEAEGSHQTPIILSTLKAEFCPKHLGPTE